MRSTLRGVAMNGAQVLASGRTARLLEQILEIPENGAVSESTEAEIVRYVIDNLPVRKGIDPFLTALRTLAAARRFALAMTIPFDEIELSRDDRRKATRKFQKYLEDLEAFKTQVTEMAEDFQVAAFALGRHPDADTNLALTVGMIDFGRKRVKTRLSIASDSHPSHPLADLLGRLDEFSSRLQVGLESIRDGHGNAGLPKRAEYLFALEIAMIWDRMCSTNLTHRKQPASGWPLANFARFVGTRIDPDYSGVASLEKALTIVKRKTLDESLE
jgi:hypothetical protein